MPLPKTPLTRHETYLANIAGQDTPLPEYPHSREEMYLAAISGQDVEIPDVPITREEMYLDHIARNGGGGGEITTQSLSVTENGTYRAPSGKAYTPVTVNVPQPSGTKQITISENGSSTEDVAAYASAEITVAVPVPVLDTLNATDNGTYSPSSGHAYSSVVVAIPAATGVNF